MVVPVEKRRIRQATREDIDRYFADQGRVTQTVTAWVGELDGEPVGIAGFSHSMGRVIAFFNIKPEGRLYKKEIWAALKQTFDDLRAKGKYRYIFAMCDPTEPNAPRLLRYFGFEPIEGDDNMWRLDLQGDH